MKDTQTSWVSAFWCDSSRYQTVAVSESRRGRKHAYKPESFLFPPDRRVCVRLRLQNMASHQKNTQSKMSFRCDFSRYPTIAASGSRHSSLRLFFFIQTENSKHCRTRLRRLQKQTTIAVSESRHSSLCLFFFLETSTPYRSILQQWEQDQAYKPGVFAFPPHEESYALPQRMQRRTRAIQGF